MTFEMTSITLSHDLGKIIGAISTTMWFFCPVTYDIDR